MFEFKIKHKSKTTKARTGVFVTPHGEIRTPIFMPVGTKATVKTLSQKDLKDLDADIILANTYHLFLRPGEKLVKRMGGLHKWMNWDRPILTDSGGFQVFSLAQEKAPGKKNNIKTSVKIDEDGVEFKSHLDGKKHYLTPEKATKIQHDLGADVIMAFDECAPADSSKKYFEEAMERTHRWLTRCKKEHEKLNKKQSTKQALFGIVQGGLYKSLRKESAKFINSQDLPGNAIGGLSVGESKTEMKEMIEATVPYLDENKPRYLMGVGTPEDLLEAVERGIDMFDCVHPTRMARHGAFWNEEGRHSIKNERFKTDKKSLQKACKCETCTTYSRSYLRHLLFENEILGLRLMTVHNVHFLLNLMTQIRENIKKGTFKRFKTNFLKKFKSKK
ncbi:tRNA guanosine(34) transglycosylase Tgt [Candidatus Peregrinibacteria bacterium]|jgi:queuine tRNA-ribosyltransferase|nr:tRNA guanosine(34) transglycosylase Tgt [Candidatus Peregrinibacteria bacterium]MBT7736574.1 tRNA guanosine(34) transglycosylase Tgt [Candidatus Peregrinibacteria bacterium]